MEKNCVLFPLCLCLSVTHYLSIFLCVLLASIYLFLSPSLSSPLSLFSLSLFLFLLQKRKGNSKTQTVDKRMENICDGSGRSLLNFNTCWWQRQQRRAHRIMESVRAAMWLIFTTLSSECLPWSSRPDTSQTFDGVTTSGDQLSVSAECSCILMAAGTVAMETGECRSVYSWSHNQ